MGGVIKGIKKAFKAVTHFVKKYWKQILTVIVIAVACYFTLGMAAAAMPAAGSAAGAAGTAAGATYGGVATAAAATGTAATAATAAAGTAAVTAAGESAVLLGTTTVTAAAGGVSAGAVAAGVGAAAGGVAAANALSSGAGAQGAQGEQATPDGSEVKVENPLDVKDIAGPAKGAAAPYPAEGAVQQGLVSKGVGAAKSFWGGMSTGEKLMFASTAFQALSGAMAPGPTRAEQGLWPGGAYFGMDEKGNKTDLAGTYADALTGKSTSAAEQAGAAVDGGPAAQVGANPAGNMQQAMSGEQPAAQRGAGAGNAQASSATPDAGSPTQDFMPAVGGASGAAQATAQQGRELQQKQQQGAEFFEKQRQHA